MAALWQKKTASMPSKPRRKLPPAAAPIPFRRPVRVVEGEFVNAVEDARVIERWHITPPTAAGEKLYIIDHTFRGPLAMAIAKVNEWDILVKAARAWDAAAPPKEELPCAA